MSRILTARGFDIDSLVVCITEVPDLSRMTIVFSGLDGVVEQARRQLVDLVPVWAALAYSTEAPLFFEELQADHRKIAEGEVKQTKVASDKFHPTKLPISQALRHKHQHLQVITRLTHQFSGKVSDILENNFIVEL
ncbi:acetolactate synthase, regulatory subunit [Rhizina undulata]